MKRHKPDEYWPPNPAAEVLGALLLLIPACAIALTFLLLAGLHLVAALLHAGGLL